MKHFFIASALAPGIAAPAQAIDLTVNLAGVRDSRGALYVTVQSREEFMQRRQTAGTIVAAPRAGAHNFSFDVPQGEYAVSIWHDDNANGEFDTAENRPLDGWAMVGGAQLTGEPSFDQVKTIIAAAPATVALAMIYGR